MTKSAILTHALALSPMERAELIDQLVNSFDGAIDPSIDKAWAKEVESRLSAYERGDLSASSEEDVFARINAH